SEIEGMFDDYIMGLIEMPDFVAWFFSKDPAQTALRTIADKYNASLEEILNTNNDPDIAYAYRLHTDEEREKTIQFLEEVVKTSNRYLDNTKRMAAFKSKRRISVDKLVKNVRFKKYDKDLNLNSLPPAKVVNADTVILYDSKRRVLK